MPKVIRPLSKTSLTKKGRKARSKVEQSRIGILARRTLSAKIKDKSVRRTVTMTIPTRSHDEPSWYCTVRFSGTLGRSENRVPGKDIFDAVQNALVVIASDFFLLSQHENLNFEWDEGEGTGFPDFPSLRITRLPPLRPPSDYQPAIETQPQDGPSALSFQHHYLLSELLSECALADMMSQVPGPSHRVGIASSEWYPERGDIIEVNPSNKERPRSRMLVISPAAFNGFGRVLACPILQGFRGHGFGVLLNAPEMSTRGVIACHRVRTVSCKAPSARFIERLPPGVTRDVLARVRTLIS